MPPKKKPIKQLPEGHPANMLPECANTFGILTTRLENVVLIQDRISKKVWGNGLTGMDNLISDNQRQIATLTGLVANLIASKEEDIKLLKSEKTAREEELVLTIKRRDELEDERKKDIRKWWLGVATAIILGAIAIVKDYSTQAALLKLAGN